MADDFIYKYPHTILQELNLDYILRRIAEIENSIKTIKEQIEGEIFEWVQEQLAPYEQQLNDLINEVNNLSDHVDTTLAEYDVRITNIDNHVAVELTNIRREIVENSEALSALMDLKIENNNVYLLNEISQNVGSLFFVVDPFTGNHVPIQQMIDTLSEYHITDGITYAVMNTRALTYTQFNALNITYSDLLMHGHTLYQ
ncbi:MAG: hypothetical protein J6R32_11320 [Bacteroidales bacterium]|nr:hypothetical protein [Bacteroidales bacterium]